MADLNEWLVIPSPEMEKTVGLEKVEGKRKVRIMLSFELSV